VPIIEAEKGHFLVCKWSAFVSKRLGDFAKVKQ